MKLSTGNNTNNQLQTFAEDFKIKFYLLNFLYNLLVQEKKLGLSVDFFTWPKRWFWEKIFKTLPNLNDWFVGVNWHKTQEESVATMNNFRFVLCYEI